MEINKAEKIAALIEERKHLKEILTQVALAEPISLNLCVRSGNDVSWLYFKGKDIVEYTDVIIKHIKTNIDLLNKEIEAY